MSRPNQYLTGYDMKNTNERITQPQRLYFKSYLQLIHNSIGSNLFRNFYVETAERGKFDALDDGSNSCAFYVSAVLVIFKKISGIHGTIDSTIKDLKESGWTEVSEPREGDVIVWEAKKFDDGLKEHIGFSIGNGKAISMSWTKKTPIEHSDTFDSKRKIINIFRQTNW